MEPTIKQDDDPAAVEQYVLSEVDMLPDFLSDDPGAHVDNLIAENATPKGGVVAWARRHKLGLAVGAAAAATVASLAMQPASETLDQMKEAGPWVGAGVIGGEVGFLGGGALMLAGAGQKIGNPLNIRKQYGELRHKVADSRLFTAGFYVNAVGSIATATTASTAVALEMPRAWPIMVLGAADVASTVMTRRIIRKEMKPVNKPNAVEGED